MNNALRTALYTAAFIEVGLISAACVGVALAMSACSPKRVSQDCTDTAHLTAALYSPAMARVTAGIDPRDFATKIRSFAKTLPDGCERSAFNTAASVDEILSREDPAVVKGRDDGAAWK